jgi:hypothetical protein
LTAKETDDGNVFARHSGKSYFTAFDFSEFDETWKIQRIRPAGWC